MPIENIDLTTTIVGAGGTGLAVWFARWLIRTFHVDRLANKSVDAEGNVIDRLTSEINRLEKIINTLNKRIDELEGRLDLIRDLEIEDAGDLSELAVLIESHCVECPRTSGAKGRMADVVERIRARKRR